MLKNSLILGFLNRFFSMTQNKFSVFLQDSIFIKHIDDFIFCGILAVFFVSTFGSSDAIGYVGLVVFFLTVVKLLFKKDEKIDGNLFEFFLLIYFLAVMISLFGSTLFYLSFKGFLKTFTYLSFYFSAVQYYKNNLSKIPLTIIIISICAGFESLVGLYQNFGQVSEISTWQDVTNINPEDVMTRVYGTLLPYNPNLFGGYLLASLPCLFGASALFCSEKRYGIALIPLLFSFLASYTLILTGCRGAYIGLFLIFIFLFAFLAKFIWNRVERQKELLKKIYLSCLGAMALITSIIVVSVSSIRTRIFSIFAMRNDSSTSFRLNVYQSALAMFKDNWLLGIGVGNQNFREIYGLYMKTGFDALSSYCVLLEIAVESGVFALLGFVAFLVVFVYESFKYIYAKNDLKSEILVSIALISVLAIMVHGLVDTVFFRPQIQFVFWTMVAFVSAELSAKSRYQSNS